MTNGRAGLIASGQSDCCNAPAFAPVLKGFEPYADLLNGIKSAVAHPDALRAFPVRLEVVSRTQRRSAQPVLIDWHLAQWRAHPRGKLGCEGGADRPLDGRGRVARYFTQVLGGASEVRTTVTLGTPYYGSVKAAYILNMGRGAPIPLPHRRLRTLVRDMPGLYDLSTFLPLRR